MTTHESNTSNSGLIELSKMREFVESPRESQRRPDASLLTEHVPVLSAQKPRRERVSALVLLTGASLFFGLTSVAYALHHHVTGEFFGADLTRSATLSAPAEPIASVTPDVVPERESVPEPESAPAPISLPVPAPEAPEAVPSEAAASASARPSVRRPRRGSAMAPAPAGERSIDELLHTATGGQVPRREGSTRAAESTLPQRPARAHVATSFRGVARAIQACAEGAEGVVSARASVDGASGRVRSVALSGVSGAAERCMERALMGVRLDPFQQERLEITFPYRL